MEKTKSIALSNLNERKEHKCEICEKEFSTEQKLKRHFLGVHDQNVKVYSCNICTKSFSKAQTLKQHIHSVHSGHKDYKCESCGKSFAEAKTLKRHVHTLHKCNEATLHK